MLSILLNRFAAPNGLMKDMDLHLLLLDQEEARYPVSPNIPTYSLDARGRFLESARKVRRALEHIKPDTVVSFLTRSNLSLIHI